jgi:hypothetical protein
MSFMICGVNTASVSYTILMADPMKNGAPKDLGPKL